MKLEVNSAADFLMNLLRLKKLDVEKPDNDLLLNFKGSLEVVLNSHYRSHWYPELPTKGSGYRCIRINGKMDPLIVRAGVAVGLKPSMLSKMLPAELTLWIDPEEVAYRIGENGSICVLYESCRSSPSSDVDSTGSPASNSSDEFIMDRVGRIDPHLLSERNSSTPPHSANSSPTKPPSMQSMHDVGRYYGHQQMQPHVQQQQPTHQYRQNFNSNHIHQQAPPQYQQQWDGFNNNNKVLCG